MKVCTNLVTLTCVAHVTLVQVYLTKILLPLLEIDDEDDDPRNLKVFAPKNQVFLLVAFHSGPCTLGDLRDSAVAPTLLGTNTSMCLGL